MTCPADAFTVSSGAASAVIVTESVISPTESSDILRHARVGADHDAALRVFLEAFDLGGKPVRARQQQRERV